MIYIPGYCLKFSLGLVLVFDTSKIRHVLTFLPGIIFRSLRYKSLLGFSKMCCSWRWPSFISWACVAWACRRLLSPYSFSWVVQVWLLGNFFSLSFKKCRPRGIIKVAWFNLHFRYFISFPLTTIFLSIFMMSLDHCLYVFSGSLTVSLLVSSSHPSWSLFLIVPILNKFCWTQ